LVIKNEIGKIIAQLLHLYRKGNVVAHKKNQMVSNSSKVTRTFSFR
jgi:hypothetical protein